MVKFYLEIKSLLMWKLFWFTKKAKFLDAYNRTEGQLRDLQFSR